MATPTIPNGEEYFYPIIYEGNGGGQKVGKFVPFTDNGTIANSCRFNDGDSAYLEKTFSGAGNKKTFTISLWLKRCTLGANSSIFTCNGLGAGAQKGTIRFDSSDKISAYVLYLPNTLLMLVRHKN